jgi:hypothetical protein
MHEEGLKRVVAGLPTKLVGNLSSVQAQRRDGSEFPSRFPFHIGKRELSIGLALSPGT